MTKYEICVCRVLHVDNGSLSLYLPSHNIHNPKKKENENLHTSNASGAYKTNFQLECLFFIAITLPV